MKIRNNKGRRIDKKTILRANVIRFNERVPMELMFDFNREWNKWLQTNDMRIAIVPESLDFIHIKKPRFVITANAERRIKNHTETEERMKILKDIMDWDGDVNSPLGSILAEKFVRLMQGNKEPMKEAETLSLYRQFNPEEVEITAFEIARLGYSWDQYQEMKKDGVFAKESAKVSS